jgi:dTDP-4-amino-4,6-dideoxygalactose transaminase
MIPFMRLDRQFQSIRGEVMRSVERVFTSGAVLQSREVASFEEKVANLTGTKYAVAVNSGTDALIFALKGLGLPTKSRVGVTSMSFIASVSAIIHAGLQPVFFDVNPHTMLMDSDSVVESIAKDELDAVLLVHLYGQSIDFENIVELAAEKGIPIIEDCAQSIGASRFGNPLGCNGVAGCLSFDPTKVIGAYGSGGAVVTNNQSFADVMRAFRYHGHVGDQKYESAGFNSQMDSVQAAILNVKLDYLEHWQDRRHEISKRYQIALTRSGIRSINVLEGNIHNNHKYVLQVESREKFRSHLEQFGVQTKIQYPVPLHRQPLLGLSAIFLPNVEYASQHILSLPMYAELKDEEVSLICEAIESGPHINAR